MPEFDFVKSTYSGQDMNECVEVAMNVPGMVAVRDSKRAGGPVIEVAPTAWAAFAGSR
ncbi:DUF397 domain-containing protein [Streptomyces sp. NPDC004126]|uniref:DUF397 domain-containing protein n=1 Tax=Streptomyces sp. NPDC004126 TaxID=3390695 RepID=UPI003D077158